MKLRDWIGLIGSILAGTAFIWMTFQTKSEGAQMSDDIKSRIVELKQDMNDRFDRIEERLDQGN